MRKFTHVQADHSSIVLNELLIESIIPVSQGAYEIKMSGGQKYLVLENAYIKALFL